jgi:hypothetical protein
MAPCASTWLIGHHQVDVEFDDVAEAVARRAGAEGLLNEKRRGCRRFVRQPAGAAFRSVR